jgi:hypothetical protein
MTNISPIYVLSRLLIIYTRFEIIYSRLHPFENVFYFLFQIDMHHLYFLYLYGKFSAVEKKCLD